MHLLTQIPEATLRNINKRPIAKWNMKYFDALAEILNKDKIEVIKELEILEKDLIQFNEDEVLFGKFDLENRRYIGSKSKLTSWIVDLISEHTSGDTFFDVFAGTAVITKAMLEKCSIFHINDFLYSNEVIYEAFFGNEKIDKNKLCTLEEEFQNLKANNLENNYFSDNFGSKFFSMNDSKLIGEIREKIELMKDLNKREKSILISSLILSADKVANTVGHYDAYRKNVRILDKFVFNLITPIDTRDKEIHIHREDSNFLVRNVEADIAFVDPPYNSRQYSRFYHVLENLTKWEKPELSGVAMKPEAENMSDYCKVSAPEVFDDLIKNLKCRYIVVTYNNTYESKSSSSKNKITHDEILTTLNSVGRTRVFEKSHQFFNAGKTVLEGHKEFVFITKVGG